MITLKTPLLSLGGAGVVDFPQINGLFNFPLVLIQKRSLM